jgi:hypothetical protein
LSASKEGWLSISKMSGWSIPAALKLSQMLTASHSEHFKEFSFLILWAFQRIWLPHIMSISKMLTPVHCEGVPHNVSSRLLDILQWMRPWRGMSRSLEVTMWGCQHQNWTELAQDLRVLQVFWILTHFWYPCLVMICGPTQFIICELMDLPSSSVSLWPALRFVWLSLWPHLLGSVRFCGRTSDQDVWGSVTSC